MSRPRGSTSANSPCGPALLLHWWRRLLRAEQAFRTKALAASGLRSDPLGSGGPGDPSGPVEVEHLAAELHVRLLLEHFELVHVPRTDERHRDALLAGAAGAADAVGERLGILGEVVVHDVAD